VKLLGILFQLFIILDGTPRSLTKITILLNRNLCQNLPQEFKKSRINPKKNKPTDKPASFVKLPPPILAKTPKDINEISKFFKKNSQPKDNSDNRKLYAQALASFANIKKILKIKETFPNLHAKKIENIQKVINNNGKPKPKLNMTMKDPLRK